MANTQAIPLRTLAGPPSRIPAAPYRHAAPSGPWPWQNLDDEIPPHDPSADTVHTHLTHPGKCKGCHWSLYPESRFPNWKDDQVRRSKMKSMLPEAGTSTIYCIEVAENGKFLNHDEEKNNKHVVSNERDFDEFMEKLTEMQRVRVFCIEDLTVQVMQMLGTKYEIEPFFWTSSVNWIPSRYQENPHAELDDHITITLKFIRTAKMALSSLQMSDSEDNLTKGQVIDTQKPLPLGELKDDSDRVLIIDFLAIHMVRTRQNSTIITYHPTSECHTTTAKTLHTRILLAGQSVYWQKIFENSSDPTFVLLSTLWYALYAWDEAFEKLWEHICELEMQVIETNQLYLTNELHKIRAHLLHYASLLEDFQKSVEFVRDTTNPAMDSHTVQTSPASEGLLKKECGNLLTQIERLQMSRHMWDKRLKNVMHLVFSRVNIEDSRQMQYLTKAALRDSAAMKQISYLTMVFLPASFVAGVFGMNIKEINPNTKATLPHYFATAIPMTVLSIWVIVGYQGQWGQTEKDPMIVSMGKRLMWPFVVLQQLFRVKVSQQDNGSDITVINRNGIDNV